MIHILIFIAGFAAGYFMNRYIATNEAAILAEINKVKTKL